MVLKINGLALFVGEGEELLPARAALLLGLPAEAVTELHVIRRSIDSRRARPLRFVYLVSVRLPDGTPFYVKETAAGVTVTEEPDAPDEGLAGPSGTCFPSPERRPVVVGCGPAGLFSALFSSVYNNSLLFSTVK